MLLVHRRTATQLPDAPLGRAQHEYDEFIDGLEKLAEQQRFFFAITMFSYVGVKVA